MKILTLSLIGLFLLVPFARAQTVESPTKPLLHGKELVLDVLGKKMLPVISCESNFQQYTPQGEVLMSKTGDKGIGQINIATWGKIAQRMGYNLDDEQDNIRFAKYVLDTQGITAWSCYRKV